MTKLIATFRDFANVPEKLRVLPHRVLACSYGYKNKKQCLVFITGTTCLILVSEGLMVLQHPHVRNILHFHVVRKCQQSITAVTCSLCCTYTEDAQYLCCACPSLTQHRRFSRWSLTEETKVQTYVTLSGICSCPSGTGTRFLPNTKVFPQYFSFPCQYHSTNAPYSFIHLPPTLYNVFLPVLQFPLSLSFHQSSILIHSSTTDSAC